MKYDPHTEWGIFSPEQPLVELDRIRAETDRDALRIFAYQQGLTDSRMTDATFEVLPDGDKMGTKLTIGGDEYVATVS